MKDKLTLLLISIQFVYDDAGIILCHSRAQMTSCNFHYAQSLVTQGDHRIAASLQLKPQSAPTLLP